jgi:hypothetical protein
MIVWMVKEPQPIRATTPTPVVARWASTVWERQGGLRPGRLAALGPCPEPQLYATPLRLTHAAVTFIVQVHEFACPGRWASRAKLNHRASVPRTENYFYQTNQFTPTPSDSAPTLGR